MLLTPHRKRLLARTGTYRNLAIDAAWTLRGTDDGAPPLTWPLDRDRLRDVHVRWPATYRSRVAGVQPLDESRIARRLASLRHAMGTMVTSEVAELEQPYASVVLFELVVDGRTHEMAIDQSPYLPVDEACAERCLVYFKRHFSTAGYAQPRVVPGGFAPLKHDTLHRHLTRLRRPGPERHDVYARFSPQFSPEVRGPILKLLEEQSRFRFEGGTHLTMYTEYLRDIASSRVCVDVPGEGPLSYRLVEYLAVGSCVVAYPHKARLHVPLVDREHVVYVREDLSDLVDVCAHLLEHPEERARLVAASRDFFDRYLHRDQLAAYHLRTMLDRIDGLPAGAQ